jgi:AraC family transcriptional regulator, transcriptional activator of pobA
VTVDSNPIPLFDADAFRHRHFDTSERGTSLFLPRFNRFMIHRIEGYKDLIRFPLPPHRKNIYDFIFLTQGHTTRTKGLDEYAVGPNTFFFLPAYQITTSGAVSADAAGYYCRFDADLFDNAPESVRHLDHFPFLTLTGSPLLPIDSAMMPVAEFMLERLLAAYERGQAGDFSLIGLYLLTLFSELKRICPPKTNPPEDRSAQLTRQFKTVLGQQIYDRQQVRDYADLLAVTPNHLNKCVRRTLGRTAHQLIDEMLVIETKVLLKQTTLSVSEIAYRLNQTDPSELGRFFRLKTGLTLTQYRALD